MNWLSPDILNPILVSAGIFIAVVVYAAYSSYQAERRRQEERIRELEKKVSKPSLEPE